MLQEFIAAQRNEIIARARVRVAKRNAPRATPEEIENGVPLFLTQFEETLRRSASAAPPAEISASGALHAQARVRSGFTIAQVVHDYGDICQVVMELAVETNARVTNEEFKTLNACLDNAIAAAVTEFGRIRERTMSNNAAERLGVLADELRSLLGTAMLSFESVKRGTVGVGGSTGAMLGRSLVLIRDLVDRSLAEVRLEVGAAHMETVAVLDRDSNA
jgi:hypothetical protein